MPDNRDFSNPMYDMSGSPAPDTALLVSSSVRHMCEAPRSGEIKHRELNPVTIDTGKDTQCLVEQDDIEC